MEITMKQSKLKFEYSQDGISIRPNDLYNRAIHISNSEFMELVEAMYAIYCRIRRAENLPVNLPIHKLPALDCGTGIPLTTGRHRCQGAAATTPRYSIAISLFTDFSYYPPMPEKVEEKSLKNLLCNKGSKEDLEIIRKLAKKKGRHGIADIINIFLEER